MLAGVEKLAGSVSGRDKCDPGPGLLLLGHRTMERPRVAMIAQGRARGGTTPAGPFILTNALVLWSTHLTSPLTPGLTLLRPDLKAHSHP